jgi:hypothetical protein
MEERMTTRTVNLLPPGKLKENGIETCSRCGILIGPGYIEDTKHLRKGKIICGHCYDSAGVKRLPVINKPCFPESVTKLMPRFRKPGFDDLVDILNICSDQKSGCIDCRYSDYINCISKFDSLCAIDITM